MILYHTVPYSSFPSLALMSYVPIRRQTNRPTPNQLKCTNALISSRLDRTAYEAIVRQQPRCNLQLNGVDEMQAKDGCNVDDNNIIIVGFVFGVCSAGSGVALKKMTSRG
eukprot:scaffold101190_cov58-Cyclotella_meneghiniana.AAC.2